MNLSNETQDIMISKAESLLAEASTRLEEIYSLPENEQDLELRNLSYDLSFVTGWIDSIENTLGA